ncbi:MAG: hypothetical protein FJY36_05295 [Betaproteobacteria bacterium]|nr:hypothetical protein [Betaproteobacteria bacterium]
MNLPTSPRKSIGYRRRYGLVALASVALPWLAAAQPAPATAVLPGARSLPDELNQALQRGQPLVVMVSLQGCVFCRIVRQSHLAPMAREGFPLVQIDMRSAQAVRDFEGHMSTHDELARRWKVSITPTVLFFGAGGKEVAQRMEGAYQPDFYGPYLQERLDKARTRLGA